MDKKVLLISEAKGFMVNAIVNGLKRAEYGVDTVEGKMNQIGQITEMPRFLLLYLDDTLATQPELLVYLKDIVIEKELHLYLVGEQEELENATKVLTESAIEKKFQRPINVNDLVAELDKAVEKGLMNESRKKILIVDDDPTMLRTIKSLLSEKYHIYMANSGMNAITFLAKEKVDLILLDYEMPVISGAKVLEMIRSEPTTADIPVMFLTAKNDKESVMNVIALKPEKYLLKTMKPEEWRQNIDEYFESKKAKG